MLQRFEASEWPPNEGTPAGCVADVFGAATGAMRGDGDVARAGARGDYRAFQLFGLDFLLTDALDAVLIEVNGAPAAANCAEHRARMVQGLVEIAIDPLFPPARGDGDGASRSRAATEKPGAAGGWEFVCSVGPP